ncbi:MAG: Tn3 family transposase [Burkholderiales bacterium]|nr:MAG: Tn3 family transposase [Burkholderiales bacterium]
MASVERTAYPRFPRLLTPQALQRLFTPASEELEWVAANARGGDRRLALMAQLKCFQYLHYFDAVENFPPEVVEHIAGCMGLPAQQAITYPEAHRAVYRHHDKVREFLRVRPFSGPRARADAARLARQVSAVVNKVVDVINILIGELLRLDYELPGFSTLLKIAEKEHDAAEQALYQSIEDKLSNDQRRWLDELLLQELPRWHTRYNDLKRSAKKASRQHLDELLKQLEWLEQLPDSDTLLEDMAPTRLKHLCEMASVLDAFEMKDLEQAKRHTMTLALIRQMRVRARDDMAEMFIRRMAACHGTAKEDLLLIQQRQRELSEELVLKLEAVLELLAEALPDEETGRRVRELLAPHGSLDQLRADCEAIRIWSGTNYLPLLRKPFNAWRAPLFRMARALTFSSTSRDNHLMDALAVVLANQGAKAEWIPDVVNMSFASERWMKLVLRSQGHGHPTNRRYLEVCVFSYLAKELKNGDVCIAGSDAFADDRKKLLPWEECLKVLGEYTDRAGIPATAEEFVDSLKQWLTDTAAEVDREFPDHAADVTIGPSGEPSLKRTQPKEVPASAIALNSAIAARMPSRHLLDVLQNIDHWTDFTRHFGPLSGDDPKIRNARARYLVISWARGTGMGVVQASRHLVNQMSSHQLSYIDRRHMSLDQLDAAFRDMNELYLQLPLPKRWGDGTKVAADGTHYDFYDQNLLAGMHFRYKKMGAVAYRHVADNYIAVFHHFIPPGMLEALYVIEGLQKAGLSVEADTVYSDTHGQSETVFAFTYLCGIELMPRIRGWKELKFYRPDREARYRHIDRIFTDVVDWNLIRDHWEDLMQIAISIQAGRISSPLILRKLSSDSRHNRVFAAARELGRVLRTIYLLRWINSKEMRQEVTSQTNKIESFHAFSKWLDFGGDVVAENDPAEQQKTLRSKDLVATAVILQTTADMMKVIEDLIANGYDLNEEDLTFLSPYGKYAKRFGTFALDPKKPAEPWLREALYRNAARQARANGDRTAGQGTKGKD